MLGPRFLIINKKVLFILAGILLILALIPLYNQRGPDLPPEEMVAQALQKSKEAQSYRYRTEARLVVNGNKEILSKIEGEKGGPERIHIKGAMLRSAIELYQIGDTTYTRDSFTDRWIVLKGNTLQQQELFMTELNPLANFAYKELFEAKFERTERIGGQKVWVYTLQPQVTSPFLDMFWTNVSFKFWVGTGDGLLRKALLRAESRKDRRDTLQITVWMNDYNKPIEIKAPRVKPLGRP